MNKQILLIDDSTDIHAVVKAILGREPVDVHVAADPKYGLVLAASERPDLILLDVDMPGDDGFSVCQKLKADPETAACQVIFLTSVSSPKEKVRGLGLGANDYVTKPFNPDELRARVKAALRTCQVIRSLEEQSLVDPLTGLGNRRMLDRRIKAEISLRTRFGNPLSVILLNIDHLRNINQTHGNVVGDSVLKAVASVLAKAVRTEDVVCRTEGDEFVILAPGTALAEATTIAELVKTQISKIVIKLPVSTILGQKTVPVTCSVGLADASDRHDRSILERAEAAMNQAKAEGRNRFSVERGIEKAA